MLEINLNVVWTIVNILILFAALRIFLWKPMQKIIDKRQKAITESLDNAKKVESEAQKIKDAYDESMKNARSEAHTIIETAEKKAQEAYDTKMATAEKDAEAILEDAKKKIEADRVKAIIGAQTEIASIALSATEKLLQKNIDSKTNSDLIKSFLIKAGASNDS